MDTRFPSPPRRGAEKNLARHFSLKASSAPCHTGDYLPRHERAATPNIVHGADNSPHFCRSTHRSENFTSERVAAIVTVMGRYIGPMSRHPEEREVAILPATLKTPVGSMIVAGLANPVVLLTELGHAPGLPPNQQELERVVREQITYALACPPAPIHSPWPLRTIGGSNHHAGARRRSQTAESPLLHTFWRHKQR